MTSTTKKPKVVIRIWDENRVCQVISVGATGCSSLGGVGGASNSSRPDIELDPWARLIVDHRMEYPCPMNYTKIELEEPENDDDVHEYDNLGYPVSGPSVNGL